MPAHSIPGSSSPELTFTTHSLPSARGGVVQGFLANVSNPVDHFSVGYPRASTNSSCAGYVKTSIGAQQHGCKYAVNGGPFRMGLAPTNSPTCLGYVISNGTVAHLDSTTNANVGLTRAGDWVLGALTPREVHGLDLVQLVTGFGWLLRDGQVVPGAGGEIAPRTAVGLDRLGRLLLLEVDGVETLYQGLTLRGMAEAFRALGAYHAVNLDGGGSSVTVVGGKIVDYPTCHDVKEMCERPVTTFLCVR